MQPMHDKLPQPEAAMSDEEHHFELKADAGVSKIFPQQAGTAHKNGYIVIKNWSCKVVEVSTSKTGKHGHAKCHFVKDGFVSLLTENGNIKDDLRLPTDDNLLTQIKEGFAKGKDLVVAVDAALGDGTSCSAKRRTSARRAAALAFFSASSSRFLTAQDLEPSASRQY